MKWLLMIILVGISILLRFSSAAFTFDPGAEMVISLGFIILFGFLFGKLVAKIGLPMITGYLFAGILAGPQVTTLITSPVVQKFQLIDQIALGIIALTAGGELRIPLLKAQFKSISLIILFQSLTVYFTVIIGLSLLQNMVGFPAQFGTNALIAMILLIATSCVANSPATAIAVITETRSAGEMTQRIISITVVKDVLVLILMTGVIAINKFFILSGESSGFGDFAYLLLNIFGSIGLGLGIGFIIVVFLKYIKQDRAIFILGVVFAVSALAEIVHIELVLVCVTAGFIVENFSSFGDNFIKSIEEGSLPVYVIFFTISGASLDINLLSQFWALAILIVLLRLFATMLGSFWGSKLANDRSLVQRNVWTGFIGQAGITLGLAILIGEIFSESFGPFLKTVIVSAIVINQIIGPVIFRIGLQKAGEIGKK